MTFARPDGQTCPGYLALPPQQEEAPGIVMFQEWWGIDQHITLLADRLATEGFRVLVPDLYRGRVAATGDEAHHLMEGLDFVDATLQDGRGAALYLKEAGTKVGCVGFCMGGALVVASAMNVREFDAAAVFYGLPPDSSWNIEAIRIPIQGHWALDDEHFPIEGVELFERRLKEAGKAHEFHRYDAKHALMNPEWLGNFHPEHADAAWKRTVEFFHRTLS